MAYKKDYWVENKKTIETRLERATFRGVLNRNLTRYHCATQPV